MAAVLNNHHCSACKGKHTLCMPGVDLLTMGASYEFDCPAKNVVVKFVDSKFSRSEEGCPDGCVLLRKEQ